MTGPSRISHNLRFVAALLPPLALLAGTIAVVTLVDARIPGALGLALGLIAGGAGVLGVLLAYWNVVDWSNLAIIRRSMNQGDSPFEDGTVIAFEGRTCTDGPPIYPPFSATPCVAYTYVVSGQGYARQGERRRVELAQGFHLVKTRIDGGSKSLALGSFPNVEDDLREDLKGAECRAQLEALHQRLSKDVASAGQRERHATLLAARAAEVDELHHDFLMAPLDGDADGLTIEQEILPVDETVCVVGTYDAQHHAITARHPRIGPNLMVYRGSAGEVLERVGGSVRGYFKTAVGLLTTAALILAAALASPIWLSLMSPLV